jgi:hypothetical protein
MTNDELSRELVGYLGDKIARLERENSILRSELKERLVSEWIVNYEMSEEETEKAAEQYIIQMVAHNEGAE